MAIDMFLYVPVDVDVKAEGYQSPDTKVDIPRLIKAINAKPKEENAAEEEEDDGYGRGRYGRGNGPDHSKELKAEHPEPLWTDILAWSWGMSHSGTTPNIQDISMTRYCDFRSEAFSYYLVKGVKLPQVFLRVISRPKKQKMQVQEFELVNAQFSSISTGGSGGEDRLTENVTIMFEQVVATKYEFSMETEEVSLYSTFFWDDKEQKATRGGTGLKVDSLADMAKAALNLDDKSKAEEVTGSSDSSKKKTLCVAALGSGVFKKIYVSNYTLEAVKKAAAELLGKPVNNVYSVFNKDFSTQLDSDKDVKELAAESLLYVD
eukprot:TRINITY_DN155_c0_g1_i2.p1 TRINITY_DN155_c0_g1~~TRINITY_DN155_c0_g1_i2.p1  ORF type:complete len:319 (+),score=116.59 TRINITY_DN155_c0_g1_i2:132-1088(+)